MDRREFVVLAASAPFGLRAALTARAPSALVTCDSESRLAVVDLGSFRVVRSISTLPDPRAIELALAHSHEATQRERSWFARCQAANRVA